MTSQDPFTPYASQPMGKGKGHHNPAPEPASWGVLTVGFALLVYLYVRFVRRHNRCACHHHD